ncbi:hypothetical protein CR513_15782, partial [Mucuna pruriens]
FEERLKKLMKEIKQSDEIILFINEVHTLIGAGAAEGAIDAANILKPALARATTLEEYRKHIEKIQLWRDDSSREGYEIHHKIRYNDEALVVAAQLSTSISEARELDKEVRQTIKEKEEAVRNQDFEK